MVSVARDEKEQKSPGSLAPLVVGGSVIPVTSEYNHLAGGCQGLVTMWFGFRAGVIDPLDARLGTMASGGLVRNDPSRRFPAHNFSTSRNDYEQFVPTCLSVVIASPNLFASS